MNTFTPPSHWDLGVSVWPHIEVVCGVYVLIKRSGVWWEIAYVGQSLNVQSRITAHKIKWDKVIVFHCKPLQLDPLESMLINILLPEHNRKGKPRDAGRIQRIDWFKESNAARRKASREWWACIIGALDMNTIKNAHSPAGMTYYAGNAYYRNLTDCPSCKYGTLDRYWNKDGLLLGMRCIDCKRQFTIEELVKLGVIKEEKA